MSKFVSFDVFDFAPQPSPSPLHGPSANRSQPNEPPSPVSSPKALPTCTNSSTSIFSHTIQCNQCGRGAGENAWCSSCATFAFRCSICEKVLRGIGFSCPSCGHGGHGDHVKQWFRSSPECPSGCGYRCAECAFSTFASKERSNSLSCQFHATSDEEKLKKQIAELDIETFSQPTTQSGTSDNEDFHIERV